MLKIVFEMNSSRLAWIVNPTQFRARNTEPDVHKHEQIFRLMKKCAVHLPAPSFPSKEFLRTTNSFAILQCEEQVLYPSGGQQSTPYTGTQVRVLARIIELRLFPPTDHRSSLLGSVKKWAHVVGAPQTREIQSVRNDWAGMHEFREKSPCG